MKYHIIMELCSWYLHIREKEKKIENNEDTFCVSLNEYFSYNVNDESNDKM